VNRSLSGAELLEALLVGDAELGSSSCPAAGENFLSIARLHAFAESVLVHPFAAAWLECPFHRSIILTVFIELKGMQNYTLFWVFQPMSA
jgi:hypothetical protein